MSKVNQHYLMNNEKALDSMQRFNDANNIDGDICDSYPDYNAWVNELEKDPDYIAKVEKQLDRELGESRLF